MKYKGYTAVVELDEEAGILHGEVVGTRDVITFQARSVDELEQAFRDSVNDYLTFCKERDESPEKPFSGKLSLRLGPELHRAALIQSKKEKKSLNNWIIYHVRKAAGEEEGAGPELKKVKKRRSKKVTKKKASKRVR
jgi:predicted HicB family RNase H-like nuclease